MATAAVAAALRYSVTEPAAHGAGHVQGGGVSGGLGNHRIDLGFSRDAEAN
jgi:hypothetical protein